MLELALLEDCSLVVLTVDIHDSFYWTWVGE